MTGSRLFSSVAGPSAAVSYTGDFIGGIVFAVQGGGNWFEGYWFWCCETGQDTAPVSCALWSASQIPPGGNGSAVVPGTVVTSGTLTSGAWNYVPLAEPVQLAPCLDAAVTVNGSAYIAAVGWAGNGSTGGFPYTASSFGPGDTYSDGISDGQLFAYSGSDAGAPAPYGFPQGVFTTSASDPSAVMPSAADTSGDGSTNFWVDVQVSDTIPIGYTGTYRLWPNKFDASPATTADSAVAYSVATETDLTQALTAEYIHYFVPDDASTDAGLATNADIWDTSTQVAVVSVDAPAWVTEAGTEVTIGSAGQWVKTPLPEGTVIPPGTYRVSVYNANGALGGWSAKDAATGYFTTGVAADGITSGPLTAPNQVDAQPAAYYPDTGSGMTGGQPVFAYDGSNSYPDITTGTNPAQVYWVDLEGAPVAVAAVAALTISPVFGVSGSVTGGAETATAALSITPSFTAAGSRGITAVPLAAGIKCNVLLGMTLEVTLECNVGAPYQGNIRSLATDRWISTYPS